MDAENLGQPRDPEDLENALLGADEVQRPVVGPDPLEPAHQHADVRFFMATGTPDAIRAENAQAQLRWLTLPAARDTTSEPNLREALDRLQPFLTQS